jgi:proline dehydrogenase
MLDRMTDAQTGLIDPDILHRASNTLLRLRPLTQSNSMSSPLATPQIPVPYPGTPLDSDASVVARDILTSSDEKLLSLKGEMSDMGLLASDEGLRKGDLEELGLLWGKLRKLGQVAKDNGYVILDLFL